MKIQAEVSVLEADQILYEHSNHMVNKAITDVKAHYENELDDKPYS